MGGNAVNGVDIQHKRRERRFVMAEENGLKVFEDIVKWMEVAKVEGDKFYAFGNKSAGKRARKALDRVAKLKVQWRKETV